MSRQCYEAGDWGEKISEAVALGSRAKEMKRREMTVGMEGTEVNGAGMNAREEAARKLARTVVDWVKDWWGEGESLEVGS